MKDFTTPPVSSVQEQAKPYLKATAIHYGNAMSVFSKLAVKNLEAGSIVVCILLEGKKVKSVSLHKSMTDAFDSSVNKNEALAAPFRGSAIKNSMMWFAATDIGVEFYLSIDVGKQVVYVGTDSSEVFQALIDG